MTDPAAPTGPTPTDPTEAAAPTHSCEHCAAGGHGDAPDPTAAAQRHLALARRRHVPRLALGVLGAAIALVLAYRSDVSLVLTAALVAGAGLAWLIAAWGGVVLGSLLARGRTPRAQLALGQVLAAALAVATALGLALTLAAAALHAPDSPVSWTSAGLVPCGVAAASGWFLASGVAEAVRLRALRSRIGQQDEVGATARAQAERLTLASIQRGETLALALALGYGAAVVLLAALPLLALVLVPLAAAGAAWAGLRTPAADR